jgi:transcriptional regulator with XRE-family HTH domain
MTWREKLQRRRQRLRLSQAELGSAIGLQQSRIGRWEAGAGMPTMEQGYRLARSLGVSYDFLMDESLDEIPPPPFTPDEAMILEMARTIGIGEAKRRLMAAPAVASATPMAGSDYGRIVAEQDLTTSAGQRSRATRRPKTSRGTKSDAKSQDEGADSTGAPRRRR